jgi:glycosyltransferase involved in cell wall biosynthesis
MPKVSVILPNFNHELFLAQRIESILNQTVSDFELIILDDASTDKSREIIQKYLNDPRISHFIVNDENSGSTFIQWQKGIALAQGEILWIAESDDVASPKFLEKTISVLDANPATGLVFCPSIWIDSDNKEIHRPSHEEEEEGWKGSNLVVNEFLVGNLIYNASSAVFRKKLVEKVDFESISKFKYTGDWMFWVQICAQTHVDRVEERLNYFRRHSNNISFKSELKGLQFIEGMKITNYILENFKVNFTKRRKTMLYWAKRLVLTKLENPKQVLNKLPFEVNFWYKLLKSINS